METASAYFTGSVRSYLTPSTSKAFTVLCLLICARAKRVAKEGVFVALGIQVHARKRSCFIVTSLRSSRPALVFRSSRDLTSLRASVRLKLPCATSERC